MLRSFEPQTIKSSEDQPYFDVSGFTGTGFT